MEPGYRRDRECVVKVDAFYICGVAGAAAAILNSQDALAERVAGTIGSVPSVALPRQEVLIGLQLLLVHT